MADNTHPPKPESIKVYSRKQWNSLRKKLLPDSDYYRIFKFLKQENGSGFVGRYKDTLMLWIAIALASLSGVPLPVIGVIFGKIINEFPPEENSLRIKLIQMIVVATVNFFAIWGYTYCWGHVGTRISQRIRTVVLEKTLHMNIAYHETTKIDLSSYIMVDVQTIQTGTSEKVGIFIQSISYFITAILVGLILNAKFTAILMCAVIPAILIVTYICERLNRRFTKELSDVSSRGSELLSDIVRMVTVIQSFGISSLFRDKNREVLKSGRYFGVRRAFITATRLGCLFFLAYGVNALAFWYGIKQVRSEATDAGTIYTIIFLMLDASFIISQFGPFLHTFSLAAASGRRVDKLLKDAEENSDLPSPSEEVDGFDWDRPYDLELQQLRFAYPTRLDLDVLKDVNLKMPAGSFTGIVGKSGSGKSSLISLLLRFYKPKSGVVLLNDSNLSSLPVKEYRKHMSFVEQDPVLFSGTIKDNILHGLPGAHEMNDMAKATLVIEAAAHANAKEFIEAQPNGYDTLVGPDGASQLSGGQVARIALARALVKKPRLLILDEVTASLDIHSETVVMQAIKKIHKETSMTIIMITHRLSSIQSADNIVVMSGGEIIEQGDHDDLLLSEGPYFELHSTQKRSNNLSREASAERLATIQSKAEITKLTMDTESVAAKKISICLPTPSPTERESSVRKTMAMCKPDLPIIACGIFASMITGSLVLAESVLFGYIMSCLRGEPPANGPQDPNFYCLMFFVVGLVAFFAYTTSGFCFGVVSERLVQRLRDLCFQKIMQQDLSWFADAEHSETALVASIQSDTAALTSLSGVMVGTVMSVTTTLIGGIVISHVIAWKIAVVLLPALPVIVLAGYLRLRVLMKAQMKQETTYIKAAGMASEATNAIRTVASLVREDGVMREYKEELAKAEKGHTKYIFQGSAIMALALSIGFFVYALAYWWGARQVRSGDYTIVDFFIVLPALLFSAQTAGQVFSLAPEFTKAASASRRIFALLDSQPLICTATPPSSPDSLSTASSSSSPLSTPGSEKLPMSPQKGSIDFQSVTFSYPSRPSAMVLKDFSLSIRPGEFVAIVGDSGSGKSSLLSLIQRFYDPTYGSVLVDGKDISKIPITEHRSRISILSQDLTLFSESIFFNVAIGAGRDINTVTKEEVEAVCKKVGMHEFIMGLTEGYQTQCGRNGSSLSGGQIQRIALARALIREPSILILDEPTSALDVHNESVVLNAILESCGNGLDLKRTVVMVAHRLSTVIGADRIVVVRKGRIVEMGCHEDLMEAGGVYAGMALQQGLS